MKFKKTRYILPQFFCAEILSDDHIRIIIRSESGANCIDDVTRRQYMCPINASIPYIFAVSLSREV